MPGIGLRPRSRSDAARRSFRRSRAVNAATGEILDGGQSRNGSDTTDGREGDSRASRRARAGAGRREDRAATTRPSEPRPRRRPAPPELVIVTGMSGAGRSTAAKVLEDLGWYVVDNLPPTLIAPMVDLVMRESRSTDRLAFVVDVRGRAFFDTLRSTLDELDSAGLHHRDRVPGVRRRRAGPPVRGRAPAAPAAGRRPGHRRHRARARTAARAARRGRPGDRHLRPQRARAAHGDRVGVRRPGEEPRCGPPSCVSASSTACRSTPTSSRICGSCQTRTGCPSSVRARVRTLR